MFVKHYAPTLPYKTTKLKRDISLTKLIHFYFKRIPNPVSSPGFKALTHNLSKYLAHKKKRGERTDGRLPNNMPLQLLRSWGRGGGGGGKGRGNKNLYSIPHPLQPSTLICPVCVCVCVCVCACVCRTAAERRLVKSGGPRRAHLI